MTSLDGSRSAFCFTCSLASLPGQEYSGHTQSQVKENLLTSIPRTSLTLSRNFEDELALNILAGRLRSRREALTNRFASKNKKFKLTLNKRAESSTSDSEDTSEDTPPSSTKSAVSSSSTNDESPPATISQHRGNANEDIKPADEGIKPPLDVTSATDKGPETVGMISQPGKDAANRKLYVSAAKSATKSHSLGAQLTFGNSESAAPPTEAGGWNSCDPVQSPEMGAQSIKPNATESAKSSPRVSTMSANHSMEIIDVVPPKPLISQVSGESNNILEQQKVTADQPGTSTDKAVDKIYLTSFAGRRHIFAFDLCRTWKVR
jgi:hypothetical protein